MNHTMKHLAVAALLAGTTLSAGAQTATRESVPKGWHTRDLQTDGLYGISVDKAYDFLKNKKSTPVIVAVIDSGIDTAHEDLRPVLWRNAKEIPGNGKDDDGNGYVDDIYGWNFLGGKDGRNVGKDSDEASRVYHKYKDRFEKLTDSASLSSIDRFHYASWKRAKEQVAGGEPTDAMQMMMLRRTFQMVSKGDSLLQKGIGKATYTGKELDEYKPDSEELRRSRQAFLYFFTANNLMEMSNKELLEEFKAEIDKEEAKAEAGTKAPKAYRAEIVKDNYEDINDRYYGNADVMASDSRHGTHVSGIIGAVRNNGKGMDGVADNVKIMMVRAVPDGDEHDKDVALAIRYAVDNGAKVINMSFGKGYSPEKNWVDDAVKYAASKGVLLVHAAGNDGENLDKEFNYPSSMLLDSSYAPNWITVGASGDPKGGGLVAYFSNFGKKEVDLFAPGVAIYATLPGGNKYGNLQGTSMASPVVAGVAALVKSYYPSLTPQQIKYVLENSVTKPAIEGKNPETQQAAPLSELSVTGGVINAYEAVRLADQVSSGKVSVPGNTANGKKAF
ncbi:Subtilase family protein [Cnuella takakiae]|uniref:Subtilase family protein n=1 Tax=Cnuella takakiae TaxID=1302690 RepID=A0A1M4VR81_9BACT|nr:S8 family peptidase [Cnuella takakiae]SHE71370.1 Subtilase family protein [Cnuella takakiae]